MTRVTVIIPNYNYGRFLRRSIDSVLGQTCPAVECLVVDDGSTDESIEIVAGYGAQVRLLRQSRRGVAAARNAGIRASTGDLIAFLDSDDWWDADKLQRQVALLEERPELGAVGCGRRHVDGEGRVLQVFDGVAGSSDLRTNLRDTLVRKMWIGGSASGALIRRPALEKVGFFDETLGAAEDWDMWLRIAAQYRVSNVKEPLTNIQRHGTGTFRNPGLMRDSQLKVMELALSRWPAVLDSATQSKMKAMILADEGAEHLQQNQRREALRCYALAVAAWPWERRRAITLLKLAVRQALSLTGMGRNR